MAESYWQPSPSSGLFVQQSQDEKKKDAIVKALQLSSELLDRAFPGGLPETVVAALAPVLFQQVIAEALV